MKAAIGIDPGRSTTKVVAHIPEGASFRIAKFMFPSAACPAKAVAMHASRHDAESSTVIVNGEAYWVGQTAVWQGRYDPNEALHDQWFFGQSHLALARYAYERCVKEFGEQMKEAEIAVGLPSRTFAADRDRYSAHLQSAFPRQTITVLPQAVGPFYGAAMNPDGTDRPSSEFEFAAQYGMIEIGHHTTDLVMLQNAVPQEDTYVSAMGMYSAAESLIRLMSKKSVTLDLRTASQAIETGVYKRFGADVSCRDEVSTVARELAGRILATARTTFGSEVDNCRSILVAGGGAPLCGPFLLEHWPHTIIVDDARFAVAEGFARFAHLCATMDGAPEAA